ncbi:MAG: PIG-L family deacetylase [Bacteroidia bacterium]
MDILLLLAHADDETLGAGGTIQKMLAKGHQVRLIIVSDGVVAMRDNQSDNRQALDQACEILGITENLSGV